MTDNPLIKVRNLSKSYFQRTPLIGRLVGVAPTEVLALRAVDLDVFAGETLGIVGESGSGKSTLGRVLAGLLIADSGTVTYKDQDLQRLLRTKNQQLRHSIQIVFQNPYASLNPRHNIRKILEIPLRLRGIGFSRECRERALQLLQAVGLDSSYLEAFPFALSGGQRQRIAIARALAMEPAFLILDEPTSALDVSIQAQILGLLGDLKKKFQLTYLLISHNLSVVAVMADRIAVMKQGEIVEIDNTDRILRAPRHSYTAKLLDAVPKMSVTQ